MIKDYLESTNQEDWIDYIIDALRGTCSNDLQEYVDEYVEMGFDEDYLLHSIDMNIWNCECCGWWVEVCETNEDGVCDDCQDDE